jgi:tetratricopeptide (TPR) repeat protein
LRWLIMLRTSRAALFGAISVSISLAWVFGVPQAIASLDLVGVIVDGNSPVPGARVSITQNGTSAAEETSTDSKGKFSFTKIKPGVCVLRVHKDGYRDSELPLNLPIASGTPLRLTLARASSSKQADAGMQFSDKPDFTVAGITDWTAAGGHGSDVNLRASESLARDTRDLNSVQPASPVRDPQRERSLRAAVRKDPTNFQANYALGQFCLSERHYADALTSLRRAHELKPDDFQAAYDLAQAHQGAGQYEQAKLLVQQQIANQDRAEWHRLLGDVEEVLNNPLAAEREYERGVQLEPSEQNYFAWGGELLQHRAVEAAIDVFTKGARSFPRSERMLAALGAALYAHGSYEEGAQRVCEASELNPSDPQPYLFLGKMELASPRPLPCVTEKLARFARTQPNNPWANYYYAVALLNSDEKAHANEAETLLQNAIRIDSKFAQAFVQLGVLQAERDDRQSARESFEKAAVSDPSLPDPHFRLAQLYRRSGDQQRASQELQTFERLKQSDAAAVEQRRREIRQFVVVMKDAPPPVSK